MRNFCFYTDTSAISVTYCNSAFGIWDDLVFGMVDLVFEMVDLVSGMVDLVSVYMPIKSMDLIFEILHFITWEIRPKK